MEQKMLYIGEVCKRLGVTPRYLRRLESEGRIPKAPRNELGRTYTPYDVLRLKEMGIGTNPWRLPDKMPSSRD